MQSIQTSSCADICLATGQALVSLGMKSNCVKLVPDEKRLLGVLYAAFYLLC